MSSPGYMSYTGYTVAWAQGAGVGAPYVTMQLM